MANTGFDTKYRQITQNEPLWVMIDGGNRDVKGMIHGRFGEEIVFPHAVRKPTAVDYSRTTASYRNRSAEFIGTAIFEMDGQGFIVGQHAQQVGSGLRHMGAEKYSRDHMGALVAACLLQLYPDGHPDVRLVVSHPAKIETTNLKALWKSVKGAFHLRIADGRKVDYTVTEVITIEEPVADFQTFALTTRGASYRRPRFTLTPGMEFLVVNVGGWISHMVPGVVTGMNDDISLEINVDAAEPLRIGIENVLKIFEAELKAEFPELARIQQLPQSMMANALLTDEIVIRNLPKPCKPQVDNAMGALIQALSVPYSSNFASGVNANCIVVGGGGGALSFNHLNDSLFEHDFVFPAEDELPRMRFSVIRGASKGLISYLRLNQ